MRHGVAAFVMVTCLASTVRGQAVDATPSTTLEEHSASEGPQRRTEQLRTCCK